MIYHNKFKHIKKDTVNSVKETIKAGLFKQETPLETRQQLLQNLHTKLCLIYKIPYNPLDFSNLDGGLGVYDQLTNVIHLEKTSLVTYLHEFYHQFVHTTGVANTEEKARGWSLSVYYLATPKLFARAVEKGLILHQKEMEDSQ